MWWYFVLVILLLVVLWKYIDYIRKKEKEKSEELKVEDLRVFHIFPDYAKNIPYECKSGEKLRFVIKGYSDKEEIKEVPINGDAVIWKFTKGNGELRGNRNLKTGIYTGDTIHFITPEIKDPYLKERLIFISAHYMGLADATWVKIIR